MLVVQTVIHSSNEPHFRRTMFGMMKHALVLSRRKTCRVSSQ